MKIFLALWLFPSFLFAQVCTENNLIAGGNISCDSLTLSGTPTFNSGATELVVTVSGDVTVNGSFSISGGPGSNSASVFGSDGGAGGPGSGRGGGSPFGSPERGFSSGSNDSSGYPGGTVVGCAGGGGGAGFLFLGNGGTPCASPGGVGGAIVPANEFSFSGAYRGGFGGGAGGDRSDGILGYGGGGGGAIKIIANGNIVVTASGSIKSDGGKGGDVPAHDGGGGGGGSGGIIWLQAIGDITINGSLSAIGGIGGSARDGGNGGNGSRGAIRLESIAGVIKGNIPSYAETVQSTPVSNTPTLSSNISCASVSLKKNDNQILQVIAGFFLTLILSFLSKILSRTPVKF